VSRQTSYSGYSPSSAPKKCTHNISPIAQSIAGKGSNGLVVGPARTNRSAGDATDGLAAHAVSHNDENGITGARQCEERRHSIRPAQSLAWGLGRTCLELGERRTVCSVVRSVCDAVGRGDARRSELRARHRSRYSPTYVHLLSSTVWCATTRLVGSVWVSHGCHFF